MWTHPASWHLLAVASQLDYWKEALNQHRNTRRHWRVAPLRPEISQRLVCSGLEDLWEDDGKAGEGPAWFVYPGASPKVWWNSPKIQVLQDKSACAFGDGVWEQPHAAGGFRVPEELAGL